MASRDDVYREFGLTAELAQLFETELGNYLLAHEGLKARAFLLDVWNDGPTVLERIDSMTLGQALRSVRSRLDLPDDLSTVFALALDARNKLSHGFYLRHGMDIFSSDGCDRMIEELITLREQLQPAYELAGLMASHVFIPDSES